MDFNVYQDLNYEPYAIEFMVNNYFEKLVNYIYFDDLRRLLKEILIPEVREPLIDELNELFIGKGLNTKTKKQVLYSELENRIDKCFSYIKEPILKVLESELQYLTTSNIDKDKRNEELKKLGCPSDEQRHFNLNMCKVALTGAIRLKVFARYEKLLPKKRTSSFKESYPLLNSCFEFYEQYKLNKEAEDKYVTIHNNNGISEKVQNLHLCKNEIKQNEYGDINVKLQTSKGFIKLDVDTGDGVNIFDVANEVNGLIGATQSQLIVYIMSLVFEQNKPEDVKKGCMVDIDVRKYCELKGIGFEKKVGDAIYEDIKKLEKIIIEYEYINEKGKQDHLRESPLVMNTGIIDSYSEDGKTLEKQVVGVALGKWIETLSYSQFQYINKAFFKYKLRNQSGTIIPISYYINCKHRNDYHNSKNRNGNFELKVHRLTSKLDISEDTIRNQGYKKKLKASLERTLNNIKEAEGFDWCYKNGTHNSREEFENDVIVFNNSTLNNLYIKKGFTRKSNSKSKKR